MESQSLPADEEVTAFTDRLRLTLRPILRGLLSDRVVPLGQLGVLQHLSVNATATAKELAASEHVSPQSMTVLIRELRNKGLIEATPDSTDGRRTRLSITVAGTEWLRAERTRTSGWLHQAVAERLSQRDMDTIEAALPALEKLGKATN